MSDAIFRVARLEARLIHHDWRWALEQGDAIAAHWARRKAEKPAIFNGRVLMIAEWHLDHDTLKAAFFETDYANLLTWLDLGAPDRSVQNGFAMGALTSADGAFLLGVMATHTSQAGRVYFPAGTPDPTDLGPDGSVDLVGSITREIEEETGLTADQYTVGQDWIVVRNGGYTALLRTATLPLAAEQARGLILGHLAQQTEPELADVIIARGSSAIDEATMPTYLTAFLRWSFGASSR